MYIEKDKAKKLVEPHHHQSLNECNTILELDASSLLTNTRLDLAFKLIFLDECENNYSYAEDMYKAHLKAVSLGSFSEPGNEAKNSFENYVKTFHDINFSICKKGFDENKSLVPLSIKGHCLNGSHRVASSIKANKKIKAIKLMVSEDIYDYKLFLDRGVERSKVEQAVNKFIEYTKNTYIAFVWPSAKGQSEIINMFDNVIYEKDVSLSYNGAHNLLSFLYKGEKWLGDRKEGYKGVIGKQIECFPNYDPVKVIVFQSESLNKVLQIKEKVRKIYNIGKHSIHITDTKEEADEISKLVFNENGLHFLNNAIPTKYDNTYESIELFKKYADENDISIDDTVIDSGMVLSLYGIRESSDIDFLNKKKQSRSLNNYIESHDSELRYHKVLKEDLIYNPKFHFQFSGVKFISFEQVFNMKLNRAEEKDIKDCDLMRGLISKKSISILFEKMHQYKSYYRIKFRTTLILSLKKIGLFKVAYYIYKALKNE